MANGGEGFKEEHAVLSPKESCSGHRQSAVATVFRGYGGVLSRAYPTMVPECVSYQATIINCVRDFHGLAWAQSDRAYRRQEAQVRAMFICQSWQFLAQCFLPFLAILTLFYVSFYHIWQFLTSQFCHFGNFKGVHCRLCTNEYQIGNI